MASLIPDDLISEIKSAADILEIVSESVQLKKSGANHVGLCPFHSEKTPSFTVSPQKGIFYCFGCGAGGDAFRFLMRRDGLTFPEAVKGLGRRYSIDIPEQGLTPEQKRLVGEKEGIFSVNRMAMECYQDILFNSEAGREARAYLEARGMKAEMAREFKLGYAPKGWNTITGFLSGKNVPISLAEKSGLVVSKNGQRYYDRFRERIVFPIFDVSRRVIGMGGRVLDDSLPKYLNSPETPVYSKSRSLYGFHRIRDAVRESGVVYVVEGYFDLLSMASGGIHNVVATLGTAITTDHVRMLNRAGASRIVLVYDSDVAGIKAAERSIPVFQKEQVDASILVLPPGSDPDSFMLSHGADAFMRAADDALGVVPFLMESAVKKHGLSIEGRIHVVNDMTGSLASIGDVVARSLYIKALSERTGIDETAVMEKIRMHAGEALRRGHREPARSAGGHSAPLQVGGGSVGAPRDEMELKIISMMLQFPEILPECGERGVLTFFNNGELKQLGEMITGYTGESDMLVSWLMSKTESGSQREFVASLAIGDVPWIHKSCQKLLDQFVSVRSRMGDSLSRSIMAAEKNNDQELLLRLIQEKNLALRAKQVQTRRRTKQPGVAGG